MCYFGLRIISSSKHVKVITSRPSSEACVADLFCVEGITVLCGYFMYRRHAGDWLRF